MRSYNLPEWKALAHETHHQPPARRGERRRNQEKVVRNAPGTRGRAATAAAKAASEAGDDDTPEKPKVKRKPGRPARNAPVKVEDESADESGAQRGGRSNATSTPAEPKKKGRAGGRGTNKTVTSRRLNNTTESVDYIDTKAFKNFDYRMEGLEEYTPERCAELENQYWKSLAFNQPMYAADMPGTLFEDDEETWNVSKLENILDVLGTKVPGVNTAYLYLGMWKATFAWHLEDVDLYSINYIHFGAPKQWYSISQEDARRFEKAMKQAWPGDAKNCDQFLRHKTYLISPDVLQKQYGVKVNKLVHYEGEFVITYPYGYHSGYNIGYNCAESVNFATESWLEYGRIARKCNCEADNVWVDVAEIERKLRGEPTPEYYEETDDDSELEEEDSKLPTPPASVKGKSASKKRKRGDTKQEPPKKKKKIRIRIKAPSAEPCVMCPNENPWEPLLPTDNGKKAHRSCALYTPETFVTNDDGQETVHGVANIDRARLDLKCNFCRSKRGACFQCSSKKCARAFHATCALAAGVQIDAGPVPTFDEEGKEYYEEGFDFRCKMHRPKMPKNTTVNSLEKEERVMKYARRLKSNDVVQVQHIGREVFAGLVIENRPAEMTTLVDVLFDGERVEVEWKYLCVLDPDLSQRPHPSPNAVPMPEGMNKQLVSASNRQDGVPNQDEVFTDDAAYKWQEFYNSDFPPGTYQTNRDKLLKVKVDLEKADQLYYYLPAKSTEARCFFTDKVGGTEPAPRSNFLDRVAPPKPTYTYTAPRPSLAAAPTLVPRTQPSYGAMNTFHQGLDKPYAYKPRMPTQPNMLAIDTQSLANQRSFAEQARQPSPYTQANGHPTESSRRGSDAENAPPLRPFSNDQYYSTRVLPAAWRGEYSSFRDEVQKSQSIPRPGQQRETLPPMYKSVSQQQAEMRQQRPAQYAPAAPMSRPAGSPEVRQPMINSSYGPEANGAPPQTQYSHSPYGAPPTPATAASAGSYQSQRPQSSHENTNQPSRSSHMPNRLTPSQNLGPSPYLHPAYHDADHIQDKPADNVGDQRTQPNATRTPSASVSSGSNSRPMSQQWTPPSQRPGATPKYQHPPHALPPLRQEEQKPKWPTAVHQTPQEFQNQLTYAPSAASRDGAHLRMMRDKGYMQPVYQHVSPYGPYQTPYQHNPLQQPYYQQQQQTYHPSHQHPPQNQHRNSLGQPFGASGPDTHVWTSPKAPTASPLSDSNTPSTHRHHQNQQQQNQDHYQGSAPPPPDFKTPAWGPNSRPDLAPIHPHAHGQQANGQAPMLPQMQPGPGGSGNETWRYTR